jgi:flagellar protein FliS
MNPRLNPGLSYRQAAVRGASPVGLVILLYEQIIEDLRRAQAALRDRNVEARTRDINHAMLVLGYLEATLNREQGGTVADNLERFYRQVRAALTQAQATQSSAEIEQQISHLMLVHTAWCEAERELAVPPAVLDSVDSPAGANLAPADWNA